MDKIKILFLAANPSDFVKLQLGKELRDIRETLQRSKYRDRFLLESRESVRPGDISQAIFDVEPQIIHFSGHGKSTGELCFEDISGKNQPVQPNALASLFELVAEQVNCVFLNACYSEVQAKAIVEHISFVIGMNQAIGDEAAITFASGFYKALGAGRSFEDSFKIACVEMQLATISEHLTPIFHIKKNNFIEKNSKSTKYVLILSATIDEINKPLVEAIVAHLSQVSGDISLTLQEVKAGSVKLILKGSKNGFKRLKFLFKAGKLKEVLGITVQSVRLDGLFTFLGELFDDLIKWLGKKCVDFIQKLIDNLQLVWQSISSTLLIAFGNVPVLYGIFYAESMQGETLMEIWDPAYYDSKPSQVFSVRQYPIDNPLPTRRSDARVLMLENWQQLSF
ncbi:CHAT domain-containing protein [Trichormus sp. NMC-1]|uniref:CHAT domain-containing protein n=1 Tax=Trichormus sp. NMC-1 TaxID=1853259 RepID=UPI000A7EC719|nr:CHAT domain-containing protein [Trichormus sp. NMC-1]